MATVKVATVAGVELVTGRTMGSGSGTGAIAQSKILEGKQLVHYFHVFFSVRLDEIHDGRTIKVRELWFCPF